MDWPCQSVIDALVEAVWVVDAKDLNILAVNKAALHMLDATQMAMQGRPVVAFAGTPEDTFFWDDVAHGHSNGIRSDTLLLTSSGEVVHVERLVSRVSMAGQDDVFLVCMRDQRAERRAEEELEKLVAELRATLESTADGIMVTDLDGGIRSYNQHFARLWDLPAELLTRRDDAAVYRWLAQCVQDARAYDQRLHAIQHSPLLEVTDVLSLQSGRVLERVTLPQYARGRPVGRVYSYRDITQRLRDESQLRLAAKVFEASLDAVFITNADFVVVATNPVCEIVAGALASKLQGCLLWDLMGEPEGVGMPDVVEASLAARGHWIGELGLQRDGGQMVPGHVSLVRVTNREGETLHHVAFFRDVTDKLADKARIEALAYTDTLTGLPNRARFASRVSFLLPMARRTSETFAVAFIDLDRFKHINDSLGHQFGDRVLVEVASRIKICLREVDTVARLGGDEFVMLLAKVNVHGAEAVIHRVIDELSKPFDIDSMSFTVTASVGVAMYPDDGTTVDDLIKNADTAMYRAKDQGRAHYRFYQPQMNVDLLARMKLDHAMRQGLEAGEFSLHFQPQLALGDGQLVGAEALLRWTNPELGSVSPARFITVAEDSGFIVRLGEWVLERSILQAAHWARAGRAVRVSVNVSALQFQQANFVSRVASLLERHGLDAGLLELELTESLLVHDMGETLQRLTALAQLGVSLAIDDFGTGYSSLAYLKRFPIQRLKIDRTFIMGLPGDGRDVGLVRAIIMLAHSLGLTLVAEGVETQEQHDFLREQGCHAFQGFLHAPGLPSDAFDRLHPV